MPSRHPQRTVNQSAPRAINWPGSALCALLPAQVSRPRDAPAVPSFVKAPG